MSLHQYDLELLSILTNLLDVNSLFNISQDSGFQLLQINCTGSNNQPLKIARVKLRITKKQLMDSNNGYLITLTINIAILKGKEHFKGWE